MIGSEDAFFTYEYSDYYKILPAIHEWDKDAHRIKSGVKVSEDFVYSSDNNSKWMMKEQLQNFLKSPQYLELQELNI